MPAKSLFVLVVLLLVSLCASSGAEPSRVGRKKRPTRVRPKTESRKAPRKGQPASEQPEMNPSEGANSAPFDKTETGPAGTRPPTPPSVAPFFPLIPVQRSGQ